MLTDLLFYYIFLNILPENFLKIISNEALAKALSFVCGVFVTYNLNKRWTWRRKDKSKSRIVKFATLYGSSLLLNVMVNTLALYVLHEFSDVLDVPFKYFFAFGAATVASALFNFTGQKFWVFKESANTETEVL